MWEYFGDVKSGCVIGKKTMNRTYRRNSNLVFSAGNGVAPAALSRLEVSLNAENLSPPIEE
jgi:hypothetical protein